jgi:hypothetical protein
MALQKSIIVRNAELDALSSLADSGYLRIYSGSIPATPETAAAGTLLAELRLGNPAFGSSSAGILTANPITADPSADATGIAAWFRVLQSDGTTALFDGTVGTIGADINFGSVVINSGVNVSISSLTVRLPQS